MISDLERSIAKYKEEYAVLIAEVQAIKSDLASVEKKVRVMSRFTVFCLQATIFYNHVCRHTWSIYAKCFFVKIRWLLIIVDKLKRLVFGRMTLMEDNEKQQNE